MTFMQHLRSSMILGTKMTHPDEEHFVTNQCKEIFPYVDTQNIQQLSTLIENGIDPDKCDFHHIKPLSYAIKHQKVRAVKTLISYGSDVNQKDVFNKRPLDYALEAGNDEIIALLRNNAAYTTSKMITSTFFEENDIFEAALTGNLQALSYYHNLGASISDKKEKTGLLHLGLESGNIKLIIYLLNKGIDIDSVDRNGTSALILSAMHPTNTDILRLLIKRNATLNQRNHRHTSALTMAIKRSNFEAAHILIESGADVNIRDGLDTPLTLVHNAIQKTLDTTHKQRLRHLQTTLLARGAHVNSANDKLQWSPLILTASHYQDQKNLEHLNLLIRLGAKIDQVDKNKRSALMIAASLGRVEALELLIKNHASMDRTDKFGWNALMLAVYYNQVDAVKLLLYNGADVNFYSKKGLSPLKIAIDNNRAALIPILKEYGAVIPEE